MIEAMVGGYPVKPGRWLGVSSEGRVVSVDFDKDLLGEIIGVLAVFSISITNSVD